MKETVPGPFSPLIKAASAINRTQGESWNSEPGRQDTDPVALAFLIFSSLEAKIGTSLIDFPQYNRKITCTKIQLRVVAVS